MPEHIQHDTAEQPVLTHANIGTVGHHLVWGVAALKRADHPGRDETSLGVLNILDERVREV